MSRNVALTRGLRRPEVRWWAVAVRSPLLAFTVLAALLRLTAIGGQGYWFDEAQTAQWTHLPFPTMLSVLPARETTPPLYFALAWLWAHLFGDGEIALRSLSALLGIATVPVVGLIASRLASRRAGVIAAGLTSCNPLLIWYSQEARSYALLILLCSIGLLAFVDLRADVRSRPLVVWVVASTLALYTHYFAALAVVPQLLWLLSRRRDRRGITPAVGAVVAAGVSLAPLLLRQVSAMGGTNNWIHSLPLAPRIAAVPATFATGYAAPWRPVLLAATAGLVAAAVWTARARADGRARDGIRLMLWLLAAGVAVVIASELSGYDELDTRNVLVLLVPVIVAVAAGLADQSAAASGRLSAALLCGVGVVCASAVATGAVDRRPDWRPVAAALGHPVEGARAVFVVGGCQALPLARYLPGADFPAGAVAVRELDVVRPAADIGWGTVCSARRGPSLPRSLAGFPAVGAPVRAGAFTVARMRTARPAQLVWTRTRSLRFAVSGLEGILLIQSGPAHLARRR